MQNHLKNKVVVVTGAASGFGRLVALKCLELEAMVVRCDINKIELKNSKNDFVQYSKNLLDVEADVTSLTQMQELMTKTKNIAIIKSDGEPLLYKKKGYEHFA